MTWNTFRYKPILLSYSHVAHCPWNIVDTKIDFIVNILSLLLFLHNIIIKFHVDFDTNIKCPCRHQFLDRTLHRDWYKIWSGIWCWRSNLDFVSNSISNSTKVGFNVCEALCQIYYLHLGLFFDTKRWEQARRRA